MQDLRLAILASHEGTIAQSVIDACSSGALDGRVELIISNNRGAGVLSRAARAGIPWRHLSALTHTDPHRLDAAICHALCDVGVSLVLLAGYMKRLGAQTLATFDGRVLNTHPALLPAYGGQGMYGDRVHAAVLAAGEQVTGASVHVVTAEYDAGPVLAQRRVPVRSDDDVASLGARVRGAERALLLDVLRHWSPTP